MKRIKKSISVIVAVIAVGFMLFPKTYAFAQQDNQLPAEKQLPKFAPGRLIIELQPGKTLADIAALSAKYGVISTEKLFGDTPSAQEVLDGLKKELVSLGNPEQSWYQQTDKNAKQAIAQTEQKKKELQGEIKEQEELVAHIAQRQKRAPQGALAQDLSNFYVLQAGINVDVVAMAREYASCPEVNFVQLDYILEMKPAGETSATADPGYSKQWGFTKIEADKAQAASKGTAQSIVALIGTGVDYNHPDLQEQIIKGYDFLGDDRDPMDTKGSGTLQAGIIAALANNNKGIVGIAQHSKILAIRSEDNWYSSYHLARALDYAVSHGADIINFPMKVENYYQYINDYEIISKAVQNAYAKGCILVSGTEPQYKKPFHGQIIYVAATGPNDRLDNAGGESFFDSPVDICAPGVDIYSTLPGGKYGLESGSSYAAAFVSGVMAMVIAEHHAYTNEEIISQVLSSADSIDSLNPGRQGLMGAGRLNAYMAITAPPGPFFKIEDLQIEEINGDGDQIPESGEKIKLVVNLRDLGRDASSVSAVLSTDSPQILSIPKDTSDFTTAAGTEIRNNSRDAFICNIGNINSLTKAHFTLVVNADGRNQTINFFVILGARKIPNVVDDIYPAGDFLASGDYFVWVESIGEYFTKSKVYLYDRKTGRKKLILEKHNSAESQNDISIKGIVNNKVILNMYNWSFGSNYWTIIYDIKSGRKRLFDPTVLFAANNMVYWQQKKGDAYQIYGQDLETNKRKLLCCLDNEIQQMAVTADKLIYTHKYYSAGHNKRLGLSIFDFSSGTTEFVADLRAFEHYDERNAHFILSGDKIFWVENGESCHMYDINTRQNNEFSPPRPYGDDFLIGALGNKILYYAGNWASKEGNFRIFYPSTGQTKDIFLGKNKIYYFLQVQTDQGKIVLLPQNTPDVWITEVLNSAPVLPIDSTPPTTPAVQASIDEQGVLQASWSSQDAETGIAEFQYSVGTVAGATDVLSWTSAGKSTSATLTGLNLQEGIVYYVNVKAKNGQGLWSDVGSSFGISVLVKPKPPTRPIVKAQVTYIYKKPYLCASWRSNGNGSPIVEYVYAIGTAEGKTDILDWTSAGLNKSVVQTGLTLNTGVTYYFSVKAKNKAGLWSKVGYSPGIDITVD